MNIEDSLPLGKETGLGSPNQLGTNYHNVGDRLRNLAVSQIHRSNIFYFNKRFKRVFFSYKNFKQKQGRYAILVGCYLLSVVVSILRVLFLLPLFASCNTFCCWYWKKQIWDSLILLSVLQSEEDGRQDLSRYVLEWVREIWLGEGATSTGSKLANNRKHSVRHKEKNCCRLWRWGGALTFKMGTWGEDPDLMIIGEEIWRFY